MKWAADRSQSRWPRRPGAQRRRLPSTCLRPRPPTVTAAEAARIPRRPHRHRPRRPRAHRCSSAPPACRRRGKTGRGPRPPSTRAQTRAPGPHRKRSMPLRQRDSMLAGPRKCTHVFVHNSPNVSSQHCVNSIFSTAMSLESWRSSLFTRRRRGEPTPLCREAMRRRSRGDGAAVVLLAWQWRCSFSAQCASLFKRDPASSPRLPFTRPHGRKSSPAQRSKRRRPA